MSITEPRLQLILTELQRDGRVSVNELAGRLGISTETVRRDLRDLEMRGHARRVYGGAVIDQKKDDQPFDERARVGMREKARIATAALALVEDGMTVFIDTGTTTLAFLAKLRSTENGPLSRTHSMRSVGVARVGVGGAGNPY